MTYLFLFMGSSLFAGLLYLIAARRGANKIYWAIMGFFFGPFAIPFVFFSRRLNVEGTGNDMRKRERTENS
jgi:hypothetical protein